MAIFKYEGLTSSGRAMLGTIEAASQQQAEEMLSQMQLQVNSIEKTAEPRLRSRIGRNEFLLFNQQLASIAKSGIPLERGLREIAGDIESRSMRKLIGDLADDLEGGTSIDEALNKRQGRFPPLYAQIVKAGMQSGRLSEMLTSMNRHLELGSQTRRIVFEALAYPAVIFALAAAILTFLFVTVVPTLVGIFLDMTPNLPLPTRILVWISERVVGFWTSVAVVVGVLVLASLALSRVPGARRLKESIYLKIPVLGRIYHRCLLSRLSDTMALLVGAGCDIPTCLRLGAAATGSELLKLQSEQAAAYVEQGENIVGAGQFCNIIPPLFFYSMQLGSQRNELQENLLSLSDMYTQQARINQARLHALMLPILLVTVGGLIGLVVAALFLPIPALIGAASFVGV